MTRTIRAANLALAALLVSAPAFAGLLDSPPPTFTGTPGTVVYRLGPVHYDPGWVDTIITCTNLDTAPASLAIEFFDDEDARGLLARATAPAGADIIVATSAEAAVEGAVVVSDFPPLQHGKARVSATTTQLSCAAKHRIRSEDGSRKEAPLTLIKKVAFEAAAPQ
jgi:hypothetical protein